MLPILYKQEIDDDEQGKQRRGGGLEQHPCLSHRRRPGRVAFLVLASLLLAVLLCCRAVAVNLIMITEQETAPVEWLPTFQDGDGDGHPKTNHTIIFSDHESELSKPAAPINGMEVTSISSSSANEFPLAYESERRASSAMVLECYISLLHPVSKLQKEWNRQRRPLLHSMLPAKTGGTNDHVYKIIFITRMFSPDDYVAWTSGAHWKCDHEPAIPSEHTETTVTTFSVFIITCPLTVKTVVGYKDSQGEDDAIGAEYDIALWKECSDREMDDEFGIPSEHTGKVVCTMVAGQHWELQQWVEYHRLIGFDHFLIYVNEEFNKTALPDANDITYIPWNYRQLADRESVPHQAAQQHDCILRAQERNVKWLALHDVDEYFQLTTNETLDQVLAHHEANDELAGLQFKSWFFGNSNSSEAGDSTESVVGTETSRDSLLIEDVWRGSLPYRHLQTTEEKRDTDGREKMIIRPDRIIYFACHKILVGNGITKTDEHRIRLNHYKKTMRRRPFWPWQHIVHDASLQAAFGSVLRKRLGLAPRIEDQ